MNRIILPIFLLTASSLLSHAQTATPDMTVFGFTIGAKLSIPECPCNVVTSKQAGSYGALNAKHFKGYQYTTLTGPLATPVTTNTCFERLDIEKYTVGKSEQLNPLPELTNERIKIRFAPKDAPSKDLCPLGVFEASVENSKLVEVSFMINTNDADNTLETLKKKYGLNVAVKKYQAQNAYGATLNYYTAIWPFSNLWVILTSSLHTSLSEQWGQVTIELPKKKDLQPDGARKL
jgi:hypothetical protein